MACDCSCDLDGRLKAHNSRLCCTIDLSGGPSRPIIKTERLETGRGKPQAVTMVPTFCPFCGQRYEPAARGKGE